MKQENNLTPTFIMITCKGRETFAESLKSSIPNLQVSYDDFKDSGKFNSTAFFNHQRAWSMAGINPCVIIEDDIILCDNFNEKIIKVINERPDDVIQFFSLRKKDLEVGSRYDSGRTFMMCQCFYLPRGIAAELYEYSKEFYLKTEDKTCPSDPCIASFLKEKKMKYWIHCPNLVDHRITVSMIDKRRSSKRQSKTFKK